MAAMTPVRRVVGIPTAFNFLSPPVNPWHVRYQLMGVFDRQLAPAMAAVLKAQGSLHVLVVCGDGGMDGASLSSLPSCPHRHCQLSKRQLSYHRCVLIRSRTLLVY